MNDQELGSLKFLKFKNRRGTKYFSRSAELVLPNKLAPPSLSRANFEKLTKVLLNHVEWIEI